MKKLFYLFLAAMTLGLTACSDNEENNTPQDGDNLLVGTWKHNFSSGYILHYFDAAGFGWDQEYDSDDGGWGDKEYYSYQLVNQGRGQKVILTYPDGSVEYSIITLTAERLVWSYIDYLVESEEYIRVSYGELLPM